MSEDPAVAGLPAEVGEAVASMSPGWKVRFAKTAAKLLGNAAMHEAMQQLGDRLDTIEGRSIVSKRIAEAVADQLTADPEVVRRASARFYGEQVRKQENLEAIVIEAAERVAQLEYKPAAGEEAGSEPEAVVSDDWRAKFASYAGDVSEPEMRGLWARILAGEFQKPGSFSFRTLRLIAEMSADIAQLFAEVAEHQLAGNSLYLPVSEWSSGDSLAKIGRLADFGLVQDMPGAIHRPVIKDELGRLFIFGKDYMLLVAGPSAPATLEIPICRLTLAGCELLTLLPPTPERDLLKRIGASFQRADSVAIIGRRVRRASKNFMADYEVLWGDLSLIPRE